MQGYFEHLTEALWTSTCALANKTRCRAGCRSPGQWQGKQTAWEGICEQAKLQVPAVGGGVLRAAHKRPWSRDWRWKKKGTLSCWNQWRQVKHCSWPLPAPPPPLSGPCIKRPCRPPPSELGPHPTVSRLRGWASTWSRYQRKQGCWVVGWRNPRRYGQDSVFLLY